MWSRIKQISAILLGVLAIVVFLVLVTDVLLGVLLRNLAEYTGKWFGLDTLSSLAEGGVLLGFFFGGQPGWTEELATFLLVWISFLGGAIAYVDDKHLGIDLLVGGFDAGARRFSRVVSHGMVFLFALGVMVIGGAQQFIGRWEASQLLAEMEIRVAWLYLAVPVSGLLISLFALGNVIEHLVRPEGPAAADNTEGAA